tara:strand:+ start:509 stop:808 length:300 start_codon:yes stop_codon:yes gene_type:complete
MTEQEYLDSKNIVTEYVEGFTDRNGWKNTSLPTLLKDYKQQLILHGVVKSLKDEDIPTFEEYTQNYGYKRIGNSSVYKNEGTYKDTETLLKEYKKEYCL